MTKDRPNNSETPGAQDISSMSYEAAIAELEAIIDRIESGEAGLEESVKAYERGVALQNHCKAILARAEQRVTELSGGG
ncbi:MAG: exodeoxyribonuclease VII small subunit [Planctomycetes bacterium]|nr:exodeoxyribonuclease VII small subunit [Planctomycetota bacterium]